MKEKSLAFGICIMLMAATVGCNPAHQSRQNWAVHDMNRPQPTIVTAASAPGGPPSDAIVLFNGTDLSEWTSDKQGQPAGWKVENGYMEVVKKSGSVHTKRRFGDCQLHIEWATPAEVSGRGQGRGNSGVFLMGKYEVQVLDSYGNTTYPDGQAAAIYGQSPPMVNASRGPGQWQTYDVIFHRPVFKGKKLVKPATITVLHNGVLVQDHWIIQGTTLHKKRAAYTPHEDKLPISLQNHGNPVRYRNIWIRELPEQQ
ncbi:MAG TPA: DUF1080 domain-containing protein [Sedimentisphaerales bacterium]|nr:DUF1080 domain-containing protein [Sedimentisphaerales bacterium]